MKCLGSANYFHTCLVTEVRKLNAKSTITILIGYQYQAKIYEGVEFHLVVDTEAVAPLTTNVFSLNVKPLREEGEIKYGKIGIFGFHALDAWQYLCVCGKWQVTPCHKVST